jgi:hypothetical protein
MRLEALFRQLFELLCAFMFEFEDRQDTVGKRSFSGGASGDSQARRRSRPQPIVITSDQIMASKPNTVNQVIDPLEFWVTPDPITDS